VEDAVKGGTRLERGEAAEERREVEDEAPKLVKGKQVSERSESVE
jgi:hypothetical protein